MYIFNELLDFAALFTWAAMEPDGSLRDASDSFILCKNCIYIFLMNVGNIFDVMAV